jgi:hypothetical protein
VLDGLLNPVPTGERPHSIRVQIKFGQEGFHCLHLVLNAPVHLSLDPPAGLLKCLREIKGLDPEEPIVRYTDRRTQVTVNGDVRSAVDRFLVKLSPQPAEGGIPPVVDGTERRRDDDSNQ